MMNQLYMQAAALMSPAEIRVLQQQLQKPQTTSTSVPVMPARRRRSSRQEVAGATVPHDQTDGGDGLVTPDAIVAASQNPQADDSGLVLRQRKRQHHDWPEVGAELTAEYCDVTYRASVIPARKKLLSGRQLKITSGPAAGTVCDSLSEAMIVATEDQRQKQGLRRKGVANGWDFWQWVGK